MTSELYCIKCENPLMSVPVFNNGDNNFPPSFLFCGNPKCTKHGLLTVAYKMPNKEPRNGNKKGKRKTV